MSSTSYDLGFKSVTLDPEVWRKNTEEENRREREILEKVVDDFIERRMPLEASRKVTDAFK